MYVNILELHIRKEEAYIVMEIIQMFKQYYTE